MKRDVIYPTLLLCAATVESTFWKELITEMAYGNCPNDTYISNGVFMTNKFAWEVPSGDTIAPATTALIGNLQSLLGIFSKEDSKKKRDEFFQFRIDASPDELVQDWSELKRVFGREIPIACYVAGLMAEYGLDLEEGRRLNAEITTKIATKQIDTDDITVQDGQIIHIEGVTPYRESE